MSEKMTRTVKEWCSTCHEHHTVVREEPATPRDTRDEVKNRLSTISTAARIGQQAASHALRVSALAQIETLAQEALALLRAPETQERGWQDIATYEKKVDSRDSVLIAVQFSEGVFVGEAYWWDAGDRDRFNDTGWWWANTSWGEQGESRIDDPVLAWMPLPSPPAQTEDSQ